MDASGSICHGVSFKIRFGKSLLKLMTLGKYIERYLVIFRRLVEPAVPNLCFYFYEDITKGVQQCYLKQNIIENTGIKLNIIECKDVIVCNGCNYVFKGM